MTEDEILNFIIKQADESSELRKKVGRELGPQLKEMADLMRGVIGSGRKILICGNGGSAGDSQHFAAEMIVRLTAERNRPSLPALALTTDSSILTATGNDFGFDQIFSRQIEGLGNAGDILLVISTSGNSANAVKAVEAARAKNMLVAGLLGGDGGQVGRLADKTLIVPHHQVQKIQEEHIFLIHLLVELIESDLFR